MRNTGVVLITVLVMAALAAPWLASFAPSDLELAARLQAPGGRHWLGCDELGRDILSRVLFGARISLGVGLGVVALSLSTGLLIGALSGYYGGWLDRFFNVIVINTLQAFPGILLAIAMVAFMGQGLGKLIVALSIGGWIGYARLVRGQVLAARELEYVQAARVIGVHPWRIMFRHVLPNVLGPVLVLATIQVALAIITEATPSFLGVGVPPTQPSLGTLIRVGNDFLFSGEWWITIFPGVMLVAIALSVNLLGDWLRDALNPRLR